MSEHLSVWICGPFGNMGTALREAILGTPDIEITGLVSPDHAGSTCEVGDKQLQVADTLTKLQATTPEPNVIIDFTFADAAYENALFAAQNNIDFVTGTTGLTGAQTQELIDSFNNSKANAIIASNFSVGAVLMMHFAAQASKHFSHAEIVEVHHTGKKDAPSGTAITTRNMMVDHSDMTEENIAIHSLRLPGAIAHQQVHLSSVGEVLRIEHDANNRTCFMPGIILAARKVREIDTVLFSIESLLFPETV